jgi:hypothetical protein
MFERFLIQLDAETGRSRQQQVAPCPPQRLFDQITLGAGVFVTGVLLDGEVVNGGVELDTSGGQLAA